MNTLLSASTDPQPPTYSITGEAFPVDAYQPSLREQWCTASDQATAATRILGLLIAAGHPFAVWGLAQQVEVEYQTEAARLYALLHPERQASAHQQAA